MWNQARYFLHENIPMNTSVAAKLLREYPHRNIIGPIPKLTWCDAMSTVFIILHNSCKPHEFWNNGTKCQKSYILIFHKVGLLFFNYSHWEKKNTSLSMIRSQKVPVKTFDLSKSTKGTKTSRLESKSPSSRDSLDLFSLNNNFEMKIWYFNFTWLFLKQPISYRSRLSY